RITVIFGNMRTVDAPVGKIGKNRIWHSLPVEHGNGIKTHCPPVVLFVPLLKYFQLWYRYGPSPSDCPTGLIFTYSCHRSKIIRPEISVGILSYEINGKKRFPKPGCFIRIEQVLEIRIQGKAESTCIIDDK